MKKLLNYIKHQSAYTKFHSTETVLLSVHNTIVTAMSNQRLTGLCLLDLSAAFETIDHNILPSRLSSWFGIESSALNWFSSYLSNRSYSVQICGCQSSPSSLIYGVPQGSILGPLLFTLYITPLSSLISFHWPSTLCWWYPTIHIFSPIWLHSLLSINNLNFWVSIRLDEIKFSCI